MTSEQQPALGNSQIPHVGTYRRRIEVSVERMYENTLDWEHLPYVHSSSFGSIECLEAGRWGWRAALTDARGRASVIELRLDRGCRRWITRTIEGAAAGSEIWTHCFPTGDRQIEIVVDFFVPGVDEVDKAKVGALYQQAYHQLYEEDEAMMLERQRQLDQRIAPTPEPQVELPSRAEFTLPYQFDLSGRGFVLREHAGELVAHQALCPHQLGPLADGELADGEIVCPWHGYRFNLVSGKRTNSGANGASVSSGCQLSPAPLITETATGITVQMGS